MLPRLAAFELPPRRDANDLWRHDADLLVRHLDSRAPDCFARVAIDDNGVVRGLTLVRMRAELLSEAPSAHLEAIVIDESFEGRGVAQALLDDAELLAEARGATSMTLHVFARNTRARALYDRSGYDGELLRYIKPLDAPDVR